jgi:anti-anti-sigma factor
MTTILTIEVAGELDVASGPTLRAAAHDRGWGRELVLDLAAVSFIDCAGIRVLMDLVASWRGAGHRCSIVRLSPQVERVIELTDTANRLGLPSKLHRARRSREPPHPSRTIEEAGEATELSVRPSTHRQTTEGQQPDVSVTMDCPSAAADRWGMAAHRS